MSDQRYIAYADNRTFKVCENLVEAMKWAVDIKGDVYLPIDCSPLVKEQQQEIEQLREKNQRLRFEVHSLTRSRDHYMAEVERLEGNLETHRRAKDLYKSKAERLKADVKQLQIANRELLGDVERLKEVLEERGREECCEDYKATLHNELDQLKAEMDASHIRDQATVVADQQREIERLELDNQHLRLDLLEDE